MKHFKKLTMTLVALFAMTAGAWADDTYTITFKANGNTKTVENVTLPKTYQSSYQKSNGELDIILKELYGWTYIYCSFDSDDTPTSSDPSKVAAGINGEDHYITIDNAFEGTVTVSGGYWVNDMKTNYSLEISIPGYTSSAVEVNPVAGKTNEWTFAMPAFDVEIAPIYAPVAQWAKDKEVDQIPAAIEGIYAGTTDAIVKAGTVAKIGETENPQGTVMYAVTPATVTEAPALDAANKWSADVPTAKDIADEGADVLVWYYIAGADTPDGQTATAENTFNDSEICAEPIKVTVLSNKFDIQFTAANANTIEAGKATVKVGETAAEVKEGKLTGVKMNSKVTVTAKEGYKFRKVEVKKTSTPN